MIQLSKKQKNIELRSKRVLTRVFQSHKNKKTFNFNINGWSENKGIVFSDLSLWLLYSHKHLLIIRKNKWRRKRSYGNKLVKKLNKKIMII